MPRERSEGSNAARVATGILLSRVVGFLRDRAVAHYFGVGAYADVFRAVLRGPNVLQNLLGEGTISATFIPIYSRMLEDGRPRDAGRFAGAMFGLLLALTAILTLLGVVFARPIVMAFAPGFLGDAALVAAGTASVDRFALSVVAIRIVFPMTGILVLSAWALGVLNSHRRFLLPYCAPVLWNATIIAAALLVGEGFLPVGGRPPHEALLLALCIGALAGGLLQFIVQLPLVFREMRGFRVSLSLRIDGVKEAVRGLGPVIAGRGVYQLSAYLDLILASLLAAGAVAALGWAQTLYVLPVSLFGLSVAAAELPELARQRIEGASREFVDRLSRSLRQMAFLTIPTCIGYLFFGFLLIGGLYRTGHFSLADNWVVYLVLCGYSVGLLATTWSRLMQNGFYALRDTKTPAKIAGLRVLVSAGAAVPLMYALDRVPVSAVTGELSTDAELYLGAVGLALASALGAWVELWRLAANLGARLHGFEPPRRPLLHMTRIALLAVLPAGLTWTFLPPMHVALTALCVITVFALVYFALAKLFGVSELDAWIGRLRRRG